MSIAVLTYAAPHRKTQDLLLRLKVLTDEPVQVWATPWQHRAGFVPQLPHRWFAPLDVPPERLCRRLGFGWRDLQTADLPAAMQNPDVQWLLLGGAGVLPPEAVESRRVVNAHPAWLPAVRGLDALKWAIWTDQPVGVTSHIISGDVDAGWLIERHEVPLQPWDSFHSLAQRQFELELDLLARAPAMLRGKTAGQLPPLPALGEVRRRMPHHLEAELPGVFSAWLQRHWQRQQQAAHP